MQEDGMRNHKNGLLFVFATICLIDFGPIGSASALRPQDNPSRIFPLPEVERPHQICVENGKVYIADANDILVYDFREGRFLRRIGKKGQGPGEFSSRPGRMAVLSGRLSVENLNRLEFFSLDGDYINGIVEPGFQGFLPFLPVGKNYVGFPMEYLDDGSLSPPAGWIYDQTLKPQKKFYADLPMGPPPPPPPGSVSSGKTDVLMVRDFADAIVDSGKIYVADSRKGLFISVFNENGDLLYKIRHSLGEVKVPRGYLAALIKERRASKYWNSIYAHQNPVVPDYFPDFVGFKIDAGRIYAVRPVEKDGLYEVVVLDLKGRILERSFRFPLTPDFEMPARKSFLYDVEENRFVWFAYNDAKEMYELHIR